jgi:hypothetical protein
MVVVDSRDGQIREKKVADKIGEVRLCGEVSCREE